jgi:hypothetical protein
MIYVRFGRLHVRRLTRDADRGHRLYLSSLTRLATAAAFDGAWERIGLEAVKR